ncbi:hypothetical protein CDAR_33301 [Caerostris darwini]|uniref:Uncharacterized protein n=1 Tax=Caerostris darwini TaxID=1538125 RepID=A0AAV4X3D3_9ARAC|nr:hypothetical protein CDAR_33301 [Caerostris darwini]
MFAESALSSCSETSQATPNRGGEFRNQIFTGHVGFVVILRCSCHSHISDFPPQMQPRVIHIPHSGFSPEDILSVIRLDAFRFLFIQEDEMLVYYFVRNNFLQAMESI